MSELPGGEEVHRQECLCYWERCRASRHKASGVPTKRGKARRYDRADGARRGPAALQEGRGVECTDG